MRTRSAVIVMVMSVLRTCIGNMHVKEPDLRVLTYCMGELTSTVDM